jgi:hypothetical protein
VQWLVLVCGLHVQHEVFGRMQAGTVRILQYQGNLLSIYLQQGAQAEAF